MTPNVNPKNWSDNDHLWQKSYPFEFDGKRFADARPEVDYLLKLVELPPNGAVLDLCCGPGRHAIELARRAYHVVGVDRTKRYIEIAQEVSANSGVSVEFVLDDVRSFVRTNSFDLVLNLFTSFGYFKSDTENLSVLKNAFASLRSGGQMVIDTINKSRVVKVKHATDRRDLNGRSLLEESTVTSDNKSLVSRWTVIDTQGQAEVFDFRLRLYSESELSSMLAHAGFSSSAAFGSYRGDSYSDKSNRLLIVATK